MRSWKKIAYQIAALGVVAVGVALWKQAFGAAALLGCASALVIWQVYRILSPYEAVVVAVERLAAGDLSQPRLTVGSGAEMGRMATAFNQLLTQLRLLSEEATELANGYIGVRALQDRVLETGQLSAVDLPTSASQGDSNRSFAELTNQLRRLTVKAHIIANDQLFNPALDEQLPGELGEAFGMMVSNLRTLAERAEQIAGGDLTSSVEGDGDLTGAFNTMVTGLRELVEEITRSALQVASSTEEMQQVLREHEASARHQAERIGNAQRTVAELLSAADSIADNAHQVFQAAEDTRDQNRHIGMRIDELNQFSARITEILELIRSIADRSDLLALNASLEGARTGEAGKGFASGGQRDAPAGREYQGVGGQHQDARRRYPAVHPRHGDRLSRGAVALRRHHRSGLKHQGGHPRPAREYRRGQPGHGGSVTADHPRGLRHPPGHRGGLRVGVAVGVAARDGRSLRYRRYPGQTGPVGGLRAHAQFIGSHRRRARRLAVTTFACNLRDDDDENSSG